MQNDIVKDFRKAKLPFKIPEPRDPKDYLGLPEAEINGVPSVIVDAWRHRNVDDEDALWEFMERWEIADREVEKWNERAAIGLGHKYISPIEWVKEELRRFAGMIERFANGELTASDFEEIVSKFRMEIKPQTVRVNGKVKFVEVRSYQRAEDPELKEWAAKAPGRDPRVKPFLFWLYSSLYDLMVRKEKEIGICAAEDCDNLFIQNRRGRKQVWCGDACRMRQSRREQVF